MLPSAADVPVPTRGFRGGEKGRRAHHSFWSILWFKMKLFNLSTRPTSFPPHPGPALGKWLFCLNSVGRASHTHRQVWWTWRWEGDAGVSISHLLWLLLLLSFGVHPRGRPGGSLAPGALYPPSSSLTQTPTPPSLSAFAQSPPMWTGHRTHGLVSAVFTGPMGRQESGEGTPASVRTGDVLQPWTSDAAAPMCSGKPGRGWHGSQLPVLPMSAGTPLGNPPPTLFPLF